MSNPRTQEVYSGSNDRQILVWEPPRIGDSPEDDDVAGASAGPSHGSNTAATDTDAWSDDD